MSWEERDYTWSGEGGGWRIEDWRRFFPPAGTLTLVIVHLVGWIFVTILLHAVSEDAAASVQLDSGLRPWAILTHPIATTSGLLSGLALFCLWPLAARIEEQMGRKKMLALYFSGNTFAALGYIAVAGFSPRHASAPLNLPVGAMAAWALAAWRGLPFESLAIFGRFIPLRNMSAWIAIAAAVICVAGYRDGAGAWLLAAVCGGAVAPVLEVIDQFRVRRQQRIDVVAPNRVRRAARNAETFLSSEPVSSSQSDPPERDIDDLLAKISRNGLASLTAEERARLEAARQSRLRRERGD